MERFTISVKLTGVDLAENNSISAMKPAMILSAVMIVFFVGGFFVGMVVGNGNPVPVQPTAQAAAAPAPQPVQQPSAPAPTQPTQPAAPSRVQVSLDDDPSIGDANAEITIIEFSDFECPFCGRFYTQTLPQLKSEYIDSGKVKLVYRDFPLSFHPSAQKAAEAGECAEDQNKWEEMHDGIFDSQGSWANAGQAAGVAQFKELAGQLGLDQAQFDSCLDDGKYASEVQSDFSDGQAAGVSGTPTFFVGTPEDGYVRLVGAQPFATFKATIDPLLA